MKLEQLTALYSPLDQEYNQVMSGPYEDLSYHGADCTVIAALKENRISGFWRPMVAIGDDKSLKFHIERLWTISQDIFYMDFLIDGRLSVISQFLLRHGYRARPYYTQLIDLTKNEEELHANLRKSYKSLVNKTDGINAGMIYLYRALHERQKVKKRPDKTWEIQKKMSHVVCVQYDLYTSGALFYHNNHCAYYASAAGSNNHACVWFLLKQLKGLGCKFAEMGEQVFCGDKKLVDISFLKRGFGGKTVTRLILEK